MLAEHLADQNIMVPDQSFGDLDEDISVKERVFLEHRGFRALVSLGQVVEGHSLLCPRESDVRRSGAVAIFDTIRLCGLLDHFTGALEKLRQVLSDRFGSDTVFFEHGGFSGSNSRRCSTCFPHMHVVPWPSVGSSPSDFHGFVLEDVYGEYDVAITYDSVDEFFKDFRRSGEYLLVGTDGKVTALWAGSNLRFRSQILRYALQRIQGVTPTDWQTSPQFDAAIATANVLRSTHSML